MSVNEIRPSIITGTSITVNEDENGGSRTGSFNLSYDSTVLSSSCKVVSIDASADASRPYPLAKEKRTRETSSTHLLIDQVLTSQSLLDE